MNVLNYYNYFTEVEEAFVSRRGAHLLISPLDWALVESWKGMGIPLHVVLRSITKCFDGYDQVSNKGKRVNTLLYCQQEVLSSFKNYVESQVGASPVAPEANAKTESSLFPKQELVKFLNMCCQNLDYSYHHAVEQQFIHLQEAIRRANKRLSDIATEIVQTQYINAEALERDLTLLEDMIYESLQQDIPSQELDTLKQEASEQLKPHKKRMEAEVYRQTLDNFIAKRLRERHFIPRLSLFYMI